MPDSASVPTFALTYPQLMNQAAELGCDAAEQQRLRAGYELAARLVDGIYRKEGAPFLCHVVRTASIVMTETRDSDVVLASLVHAAYFLHCFDGSRRRGPRAADRAQLRSTLGPEVESLVGEYTTLAWGTEDAIAGHREALDHHSPQTRKALLLSLANELEDHLDAAPAYAKDEPHGEAAMPLGTACADLAEALGHPNLAAHLKATMTACRQARVSESLQRDFDGSYELRDRLWMANPVERVGSALRRRRRTRA